MDLKSLKISFCLYSGSTVQMLVCSKAHFGLTCRYSELHFQLKRRSKVVGQQLVPASESVQMVLDTRLVNLETCIGEVSLHNNLLHWCNGKQNGLFDFWFSDSCVKGVWNGCKQHLIAPFYYLLNIPCTAEMQWKSIVFHWHGSFVIFLAFSWLSPSLLTFFPHFFLSFFF